MQTFSLERQSFTFAGRLSGENLRIKVVVDNEMGDFIVIDDKTNEAYSETNYYYWLGVLLFHAEDEGHVFTDDELSKFATFCLELGYYPGYPELVLRASYKGSPYPHATQRDIARTIKLQHKDTTDV